MSLIFFLQILGVRGDDCGFCAPGLPGSKGDFGDAGNSVMKFVFNYVIFF